MSTDDQTDRDEASQQEAEESAQSWCPSLPPRASTPAVFAPLSAPLYSPNCPRLVALYASTSAPSPPKML
eukprot:668691-Pleurochrysis_carterae.AAC.1